MCRLCLILRFGILSRGLCGPPFKGACKVANLVNNKQDVCLMAKKSTVALRVAGLGIHWLCRDIYYGN